MTIAQLDRKFRAAALAAVDDTIGEVASGIGKRVPRDTGGLAGTLEVEHAHQSGEALTGSVSIGDDEHPSGPPEFGTIDTPAQPFYRPSIITAGDDLLRSIKQRFR